MEIDNSKLDEIKDFYEYFIKSQHIENLKCIDNEFYKLLLK